MFFFPTRGKALLGYLSPRPRSVIDTYSKEMETIDGDGTKAPL
jgi:hypothetical protein